MLSLLTLQLLRAPFGIYSLKLCCHVCRCLEAGLKGMLHEDGTSAFLKPLHELTSPTVGFADLKVAWVLRAAVAAFTAPECMDNRSTRVDERGMASSAAQIPALNAPPAIQPLDQNIIKNLSTFRGTVAHGQHIDIGENYVVIWPRVSTLLVATKYIVGCVWDSGNHRNFCK